MKLISSMATRHLLTDLAAAAAAAGLPRVDIESVGGVAAEERVAAGESFDLVFLAAGALARLAASAHVTAVTPLALSQVAVAVTSGTDAPASAPTGVAFDDAAGLQRALRDAGSIGYSTGPSGTMLITMIDDWGLSAELGDRLVQARPGVPVASLVATGDVSIGLQQLSELVGQPGVRILGVLPADCAIDTVFSGSVAQASSAPADAHAVLDFFTSPAAGDIIRAHHFATA